MFMEFKSLKFTQKQVEAYRSVRQALREQLSRLFGVPLEGLQHDMTFFSHINASKTAQTVHDQYWHSHIDTEQYGTFAYTVLLYLNTGAQDFDGGEFIFEESRGEGFRVPAAAVEPRAGRIVAFSSDAENPHKVLAVSRGVRMALTAAFTCSQEQAMAIQSFPNPAMVEAPSFEPEGFDHQSRRIDGMIRVYPERSPAGATPGNSRTSLSRFKSSLMIRQTSSDGDWFMMLISSQGKTLVEPWGPWPPDTEDSWVPAWPSALKDACTATDPEEEHLQADLSEDCDSDWAAAIRAALPEPEGGFPSEAFSSYSPTACPDSGTSQEEYLAKLEQRLDSLRRVPKRSAVPWREGHQAFRLLGLGTQAALAFRGMATESAQQGSAQTFDAGRFGRWLRMMLVSFYTDEEAAVADALSITMSGGYTNGSAEGRREYDHPIVILGGGMGGLMTAVDFLRQNRKDFIILERYDAFGGTTWRDVANETTKLQTEKGTYVPEYLDPEVHADEDQKTWPSRDSILDMCVACAEKHGLEDKAKFNTSLEKVEVKGDLLAGGHIELSITTEDSSETLKCSALVSCPGVFYNPIDLKWPGREEFGGYITHGSYDGINYDKLKDATVCIVGHGGFTIENVRTCVERKSKKIYIVCRHRHLAGPKMVSWMVSGAAVPIPGPFIVEAFQKMYGLLGVDVWSHPVVNANADRSSAVLTQTTTFGVTDIYFLACYYKVCEVVHGEIDKLSKGKVHLKDGKELECNVIMKCLGSHGATDFDDIIGFKFYQGWWVNGEPLMPCMAPAKGVQAKNFAGFSLAPGYAGQIITNRYFIDHPEKFLGVRDWLPKQNRDEHYECNYIYKGAHVLATMVILQTQFPDLAGELAEADKLKAYKHIKAHPLEKHLDECLAEWKMYIKMMKDHGQIPADAEEVEYPYTKENLLELDQRCQEALKAEWEKMMAKKAKVCILGILSANLTTSDAQSLVLQNALGGGLTGKYASLLQLAAAIDILPLDGLVPDCIVDKCSEGTGEKLQAFYRISPVAVAVAAQRFQLLEMSLSAQTQEQYVCKECNRVYDTMQAMSTSFSCECGQALASTAEESEARRDRLHRYKSTANMVRSRSVTGAVVTAFGLAFVACRLGGAFVGSSPQLRGGSQVARRVGVDYLLRNGPKDADPPLMDPNTASGATHEIEFKKKPFGILRYAPGPSGNGAVVREVKQESRYPGDPQGQAFVAGVQPGWVVASVNGQDAKNIKFEDLMEFMDDEVLDPVAALSLNLKENGVSSEGKGIGESTFTFGGGNLAPLPIKVVYQEHSFFSVSNPRVVGLLQEQATGAFITWMVIAKGQLAPETHAGFHVQCKELLKLTQELENLPGPQFGHPPKVKKPRGAAKQSAKAKAAASEQRPAPADDIRANQMQVDIASTLESKDSEDAQVPPADTVPALSAEQEISKTVEEEVGAHNQSTRTSLEARLRGTQRSQPQEVHEDPIVVVRGEPLPLSRVLADDDLQEQMTDQEYQSFYDVDRNLQHRKWLETGGFRPILRWIVPGSWSP
ncbi:OGFOD3, partial [Symbiodinium necroappetens]